jgi:transposase
MHRSNPWASDWLKRYDKEGLEGLKDSAKAGRPSELSEDHIRLRKKIKQQSRIGQQNKVKRQL